MQSVLIIHCLSCKLSLLFSALHAMCPYYLQRRKRLWPMYFAILLGSWMHGSTVQCSVFAPIVVFCMKPPDPPPALALALSFPSVYHFNTWFGYRDRAFYMGLYYFASFAKKPLTAGSGGKGLDVLTVRVRASCIR